MLRINFFRLVIVSSLLIIGWSVNAQTRSTTPPVSKPGAAPAQLSPEEIIRLFTAKESELREVVKEYSYQQESILQVLGPAKVVSGEFYQVSEFVFDDAGHRIQRIIKAPMSTLDRAGLSMTSEDQNAFINLQPFALTLQDLPNYNLNYVGREKIDELNTYVFEVTPKVMTNPRELDRLRHEKIEGKYFQGKVWVDDQDFQVVKSAGKTVPEFKQRFPKFETYRENIDGRYWFPTFTTGDDELVFDKGPSVRVHMTVRYKKYRQFRSDVRIIGDPEEVPSDPKKETGKTKPPIKPDGRQPELPEH